jgi:Domain of unknown function (DUF4139)/N-terminal domain of unknown function (DUF4140)
MKKLIILLCAMPFFCLAQTTTTAASALSVNSKIERVTVFLQGAQVERKGNSLLVKGRNELIFKGLSPYLDKESIRLKGDGNFTVLSVNFGINHIDEAQKRTEVAALETQQKALTAQSELEAISVSAWQYEIASLQKNDVVSSTQNGVKTADLKELMDYRTARLRETNLKIHESNKKITNWYEEKQKISAQLSEINAKSATYTGEITIVVNAEASGNANFDLSYSVSNASWQMSYDLRVKDVVSPMNLLYKANVQQQSGEDWKDVKLTFSTGNPTYNNAQPKVEPWYLRDEPYVQIMHNTAKPDATWEEGNSYGFDDSLDKKEDKSKITVRGARDDGNLYMVDGIRVSGSKLPPAQDVEKLDIVTGGLPAGMGDVSGGVVSVTTKSGSVRLSKKTKAKGRFTGDSGFQSPLRTTTTENLTNTLYEVGLPYTVLNDGKTYTAEIRNGVIPASYEYFTAPKESSDAYLTALVTNWDELQLVGGEAALYYEGTYMGKTLLNPDNTNDTLRISLGIDKGIVVQRTKLKEYAKKQFWGDKQSDERAYEIAIRNRKAQPINIIIEDHFPLSAQKEISVERIDAKDAKIDDNTGKLTWKQTIEPSKERKFVLHYKIKYPKGWNVKAD